MTALWVLQPSEIKHMVFTEPLLAKAVFTRSIKVLGWQPGAPKTREYDFPTKRRDFLKLIGPVTALWVLQPSEIKHMVFTDFLLAKAVCTGSIKVFGWQPVSPKTREHSFPTKRRDFLKLIGPVTALWVL